GELARLGSIGPRRLKTDCRTRPARPTDHVYTMALLGRNGSTPARPNEFGWRHAKLAPEHGRKRALILVAEVERDIQHGLAAFEPIHCSTQADDLAPLNERHAQFLHEQTVQGAGITAQFFGPFLQGLCVVEMLLDMGADPHEPRVARCR